MSPITCSPLLRRALAADSAAGVLLGGAFAAGASWLQAPLGLPAGLSQGLGLFLLVYAVVIGWLATRPTLPSVVIWAVMLGNVAWAAESVMALALGWLSPTPLGVGVVLFQAAATLVFADLQFFGLRRSTGLVRA